MLAAAAYIWYKLSKASAVSAFCRGIAYHVCDRKSVYPSKTKLLGTFADSGVRSQNPTTCAGKEREQLRQKVQQKHIPRLFCTLQSGKTKQFFVARFQEDVFAIKTIWFQQQHRQHPNPAWIFRKEMLS